MHPLLVHWVGRVSYARGVEVQREAVAAVRRGEIPDTLLLLEHDPVITIGRRGSPGHVRLGPGELARRGIELCETDRGGDVTYHGPGQLVGYPILALAGRRRDAHRYLRDLEQVLIDVAATYGIAASRVAGLTGVWVGGRKLAAIGVRLSTGWITSHGFSVNVGMDLGGFDAIVPCGLAGRGVTSLGRLLGHAPPLGEVAARCASAMARVMDYRLVPWEVGEARRSA
jgi:lipoyl(octanoyl) transferase